MRNVLRQCRLSSYSWSSATPCCSLHSIPSNLCAVRAISTGIAVNGALTIITLSRAGTLVFQFPPSSASAHTTVAGSVGRHSWSRGPVGTPWIGTCSVTGSFASGVTFPERSHTSTSCAKRPYVTEYEYGLSTAL